MALALGAALWLAWPRRLWWGTQLLIAAAFLGPPYLGLSKAVTDQLHFANPNALVVLGIVITWIGRRHGSVALVAGGLVLAAVKIVPAVGLAAWLLADRRRGRAPGQLVVPALLWAAAIVVALTVPILAIDPGALADTVASQGNLVPWPGEGNLAPGVRLAPVLGMALASWLSRIAGLVLLGVVLVRRLDGPGGFLLAMAAPLLLTPQLWAHWFLVPGAAALIAAGEWSALRTFDRRLRLAWLGAMSPARMAAGHG
jgi:hypothetical protein